MLKHLCHSHITFEPPKDEYDRNLLIGTSSNIVLKKSKLSPKFVDIPCYIDVTKGGRIDEVESFFRYITSEGIGFVSTGSYYKFNDYLKVNMFEKFPELSGSTELVDILNKSYRRSDMISMIKEDPDFVDFLQIALIEFLDDIYTGQRSVNIDYRDKLISGCKYFSIQPITENITDITPATEEISEEE